MKDMISVAPGFQYSVNIGYDFGSDDKLKNFIPTKSAMNLLENILISVNPTSTDRARVLIGAYGKGKSHIVLTILSILMKRNLKLFKKLMPKIEENPKIFQLVQNYYKSEDKILPVVINGSSTSLTQSFLLALQRTLSEKNLLDAMPETNYKAAIQVIKRWKENFPETFSKFQNEIEESVSLFVERLENYDSVTYEKFERLYPALTAGSSFNPFLGFDVVELYESAAKSLKKSGYSGIYVVYDEFSKFLESNISSASVSDTKMLQDFAEKCCRSGALQFHLMLISHKEISNYIDKLPKEKTDGWRGVSECFTHIHLNNNFSQTYEIISSVIQHKEPQWKNFCNVHRNDFNSLFARYTNHQIFRDATDEIETAIKGCFPLHPVSTFILPRLSERVAQNERTLFTFLSAEGTATLATFLKSYQNNFSLVTPDLIYDYFEPLFKKEIYSGEIHNIFVLTSTILNQLEENNLGSKIIKTISLIYILEQFERLNPTKEQIIGIYSGLYDVGEIERAISELIDQKFVVYIKRSNDYLRLKQNSGVDVQQKIHDYIESRYEKIAVKDILNASNFDNYIYPSRYNEEHEMTRFFSFQFISGGEVAKDINWSVKSENIESDGIIYGIIPENDEQIKTLTEIIRNTAKGVDRCIFVIPKHFKIIDSVIREYDAVEKLRDNAEDDPVLFDEYEVIFEDLQELINNFISEYTRPERNRAIYIYNGEIIKIYRKSAFTELMSKICDTVYSMTPIINNESVNKNDITSVAQTSRSKIISALLRSELENNLGLSGTGQDISIMRSALVRTGIWSEEGGLPQINLRPKDTAMSNLLETIEKFILEARQKRSVSFSILYERLTSPKYHIGLRYGLIPIYIAVVMHNYRQQTVISDKQGTVPTNADILVQINSNPKNFTLEYLEWNPEKEKYIARLAETFSKFVIDAEKVGNSYDYVANAMYRWYMSLPKFSRESVQRPFGKKLIQCQLAMIKILRQNIAGSELLFKKFPEIFNCKDKFSDTAKNIIETKLVFDGILDELKKNLIDKTAAEFSDKNISMIDAVKEWSEKLNPKSFEQLFSDGTDHFLRHIKSATNDEDLFITRLAKIATGLRLEDWNDKTFEIYTENLKRFIKTAEEFHGSIVTETINDTSNYKIVFADEKSGNITRRFDKVEISSRGKLLFNQITAAIESMGHAISEQEKRQVLMEVLKKLC